MAKKGLVLLLAVWLVCFWAISLADVAVTDMYGREVTLPEPATRIVALTASDCEILCALGAEDALVGRGEYCDYPASILDVPVVQSGAGTNLEEVLALAPQVVLMSGMAQDKAVVDMLEASGVRVAVSNATDIAGVYASIRMIGGLMAREAEAEALIADMQATFDGIAAQRKASGKTVYFEVSPLQWGLWTAGKHTFMDELAEICGLTNAFADVDGWAGVSEEQVLLRNPDYIVTLTMPVEGAPTPVEEIMARNGWGTVAAVKHGAVFNADNDCITRPGPRLADAALALYAFVTGGAQR